MGPLDAFWHLANFFLPALWVAAIAAAVTKLVWRRELAAVPWRRLFAWPALAASVALVGGLIITGRDGRIATYAAMVFAAALAMWWVAFGSRRR